MPENKLDMGDIVATIFIILGVLSMVFGIALANVWTELSRFLETAGALAQFANFDAGITALICFAFGILYIITGYLVAERYKEGQYLATFLGILMLFAFPVGTVIGLITIYTMAISDVRNEFINRIE